MKRDKHRLHRLKAHNQLQSPVQAGDGDYLMQLAIGTPPENFSAIIDTGSDLIWTQCKPCSDCFNQSTPIFDPEKSSSFSMLPCSSNLCKTGSTLCSKNTCNYVYNYGDDSSTKGTMATETFTFENATVPNIGFGCGDENKGSIGPAAGIIGLGRGPLSLVSQLDEPTFSYCLTSIDDENTTSTLSMGFPANKINKDITSLASDTIKTTPLYKNPSHPSFYYLSLSGISVGDVKISTDQSVFSQNDEEDSTGGMIIDSGTTLTYLDESIFDSIVDQFSSQTKLVPDDSDYNDDYDACFKLPSGTKKVEYPKLVFHFDGASLDLPAENYLIEDLSIGMVCLAMGISDGLSVLGNLLQQNILVVYDLEKEKLSFMPTKCDQM